MNCKYKSSMTKKKAFTLIELLIVITIIGILFIVLVSKVDFATDKAKASGVQTDFRSFQVALETVSKENAGFNTFGWDTGDNAGAAPSGYTYTNATKDAGDRIRNSYDEGDTNLNGIYDDGEVWTGRKIYTETWTGCYTLINPGNASDMSAIFDLETAINKNLDPKLHIVIADDGTITMANGYKDPWSTQYHGRYITNASADAAAKWNTDASMAGSTGDNMDRGAILMYSNGANQKFGTKVKIEKGVVTATVSQIDANTPDNNKIGADDYVLAVVYTYTNGYGETGVVTEGFSNDQAFSTGTGGNVSNMMNGGNNASYSITYISDSRINKDTSNTLTLKSDANISEFVAVTIDGNELSPSLYTVREGSTIVEIKSSALTALDAKEHTFAIVSTNGTAECTIEIFECAHNVVNCYCNLCGTRFCQYNEAHECWECGSADYSFRDLNLDKKCDYCHEYRCACWRDEKIADDDGDYICDGCGEIVCIAHLVPFGHAWNFEDHTCYACNKSWCELDRHYDDDGHGFCDGCMDAMCQHGSNEHPTSGMNNENSSYCFYCGADM